METNQQSLWRAQEYEEDFYFYIEECARRGLLMQNLKHNQNQTQNQNLKGGIEKWQKQRIRWLKH